MAPCTHPGMKRLFLPYTQKRPRSLRSLGLASLLLDRSMRKGGLILAADCVRSKEQTKTTNEKNTRNPAALKTHHEIHNNPATATTSRWRATKPVPRVSLYSPASIDPGLVEIDLVQLLQL